MGLDPLEELWEFDVSGRGIAVIATIFALINLYTMPTILSLGIPAEFPDDPPTNYHVPGTKLELTVPVRDRFLQG
jgi:hypothetical protein